MPPKSPLGLGARDVALRLYERRLPLGLGVLALLLAISGWWGYRTWRMRQEEAAQALMTKALTAVEPLPKTGDAGKPVEGRSGQLEAALQMLVQVRKEYPSSQAAEHALLQIGNISYHRGEPENALQAYQEHLEQYPRGSWVFLAGLGKGYTLEALGRWEEAAGTFRSLGDRYKDSPISPEALMGLARCLRQLDRRPEAMDVYRRVIEEHGGTAWARQAEEVMGAVDR